MPDGQGGEHEAQGHHHDQAHLPSGLGACYFGALDESQLLPGVGSRGAEQILKVGTSEAGSQNERSDRLVRGCVGQLRRQGGESPIRWCARLDPDDQAFDIGPKAGGRGWHCGLDGRYQSPMGGHAVTQGLDPGGQGVKAVGHPVGGGRRECRPQSPSHRCSDECTDRPAGDESDHRGTEQGCGC